jgi:hypothetical protein
VSVAGAAAGVAGAGAAGAVTVTVVGAATGAAGAVAHSGIVTYPVLGSPFIGSYLTGGSTFIRATTPV